MQHCAVGSCSLTRLGCHARKPSKARHFFCRADSSSHSVSNMGIQSLSSALVCISMRFGARIPVSSILASRRSVQTTAPSCFAKAQRREYSLGFIFSSSIKTRIACVKMRSDAPRCLHCACPSTSPDIDSRKHGPTWVAIFFLYSTHYMGGLRRSFFLACDCADDRGWSCTARRDSSITILTQAKCKKSFKESKALSAFCI